MSSGVDDFESTEEFQKGYEGEQTVVNYLERNGWETIPTFEFDGDGAPMLTSDTEDTIIPDILTSRDGVTRWVEVKTKPPYEPPEHVDDVLQQGVEVRHWANYCTVQDVTGIDVWVFFFEQERRKLCIGSLRRMDKSIHRSPQFGVHTPTHYWTRESLRTVDPHDTPEAGAFGDEKLRGWL